MLTRQRPNLLTTEGQPISRATAVVALLVVTFAIFVDILIYGMIIPILPHYTAALGIPAPRTGVLFGSYAATLLLATPLCGVLADRVGRRRTMVWGLSGLVSATLLLAVAQSFALLITARLLQGAAAAATWTAGLTLIADVFPTEARGRAMGTVMTGSALGMLVGPIFGGFLYEWGGYQLPFLVAACLALIDGLARMTLLPHTTRRSGTRTSILTLLRNWRVLLAGSVVLVTASVLSLLEPTLPLYLHQQFDASSGMIGLLFGIIALASGLMTPLAGILADRYGRWPIIHSGLLALTLTLPLIALPHSLLPVIPALFLVGSSAALALTPPLAALADAVDEYGRGAYASAYAIFNLAYAGGMLGGPVIGGILISIYSFPIMLIIISGGVLAVCCALISIQKH